MLGTFSSIRGT